MLRMTRRLRRAMLGVAISAAALALPATSFAAVNTSVALSGPSSGTSGAVATYDLVLDNTGDDTADAGVNKVTISLPDGGAVVALNKQTSPGTNDDKVTCDVPTSSCTIAAGFTGDTGTGSDPVTVKVDVQFPLAYISDFRITATGSGVDWSSAMDTAHVNPVSKGSYPSFWTTNDGSAPTHVTKDTTYVATVKIQNQSSGSSEGTHIRAYANGTANEFSPTWGGNPAFNPVATVSGPGCTPTYDGGCDAGAVAPNQELTLTVTVTGLTHFGSVWTFFEVSNLGTSSSEYAGPGPSFAVDNGKTLNTLFRMDIDSPAKAAGQDFTVTGEVTNIGPDAIERGYVHLTSSSVKTDGTSSWDRTDTATIEPFKSITMSNGKACANEMAHWSTPEKPMRGSWYCPIDGMAAGTRVTFTAVLNYPITVHNFETSVNGEIMSAAYVADGADRAAAASFVLNPDRTVDLEPAITSNVAMVGADRVVTQTITVKNAGNYKAEQARIGGSLRGVAAGVLADKLPANCTGASKPTRFSCNLGDIAAGGTASVTIKIKAGTALGVLSTDVYTAGYYNDGTGYGSCSNDATNPNVKHLCAYESNVDNNEAIASVQVVPAATVPLLAKFTRVKPQSTALTLKRGMVVSTKCPTACSTDITVAVSVAQAKKLGIKAKGKKPIVIMSGKGKIAAAGTVKTKVVVVAKYKKQLLKYIKLTKGRKPFTTAMTAKTFSTDPESAGASTLYTQPVVFKK